MGKENKSRNSVVATEMELDIYSNIFEKSPRLTGELEEYSETLRGVRALSEDIYLMLFKYEPEIRSFKELEPKYRLNGKLVQEMDQNHEIKSLRKRCEYKYLNSIIATEIMLRESVAAVNERLEKSLTLKSKLKSLNKAVDEYDKSPSDPLELEIDRYTEEVCAELAETNFFYKVLSDSYKEFVTVFNTIKNWGLDDGKLTTASYDEKMMVAGKLRKLKKVRDISEMAGRFKASASSLQRKKTKEDGMEICGVEIGNEIHRVLPSEKILLANEKTKRGFLKKYTQKELLSYKYRNNRSKSKGPIICCIDTSSSMEGELEVWSKSIAMTLMDIAFKQKREFVAVLFSYKVGQVIEFNKNRIDPSKIYDLATAFFGSGTNFVEPLNEAIKLINTAKYKYSDIIFITDGEAPLDDEFIAEFKEIKEKKQFRMITVNVSDKIEPALDQINDIQILLRELTDEAVDGTNETIFSI
ncbi:protein ViaA [Andreesenia angusta]|uniref:Protein ViaA n=1 Tax=Andreesenia angusta TaxID=39480 RepID=A0A1S1V5C9_9FIRM|nr:VWA domain-containing protein [Andreesenia angusta]OHW61694.1 protein ViaA [Andreesenia angusta]